MPEANPAAPDSGVAVKRCSASDGEQSKLVASQEGQEADQDARKAVISGEGKEAAGADDDHGAEKVNRHEGGELPVDINRALHNDGLAASPSAAAAGVGNVSPSLLRRTLLEIKKREMEIEGKTLELERRRLRWAEASCAKDGELEKMRQENGRIKLENERLWRRLFKRRERELGVESKTTKRWKGRGGAGAGRKGEAKPVA